jgi:hypothetical protein
MNRILYVIIFFMFLISPVNPIYAQPKDLNFTFSVDKKDSSTSILKVLINEGDAPFKYSIYEGDPMNKGTKIISSETENKIFNIEIPSKPGLFLMIIMQFGKQRRIKIKPID